MTCTGVAASWCPDHSTCTCPRNADGEVEWHWEAGVISLHGFPMWTETAREVAHWADDCPLHGDQSSHPA